MAAGIRWLLRVALLGLVVSAASSAWAQEKTLSGSWSASALTEAWRIGDWGDACGAKPTPGGAPSGSVVVKQNGNELSISGAGRAFSTTECWEQMPGLSRTSHAGGARAWRTRCSMPPNDPRQATIVTTIQATDTTISLTETGQYQFVIKGTNCTAAVTRARTFTLVAREGEAAPAAAATASAREAAKPAGKCAGPRGNPARLEVVPRRKLLRAGDRFVFRAAVLDAENCAIGVRPAWSIAAGPLASKASVDPSGAVTIAGDADEGQVDLAVAVGGKGVTIPIRIASPEKYEALLASDYKADADQAAIAVIATGTIGGKTAVAQDSARERKVVFVAIVAGVAGCLGIVGLALLRRGRRAERASMATESMPMSEPRPSAGFGAASTRDSKALRTPPATFTPEQAVVTRAKKKRPPKGKICPTCGDQYPPEATFCGKDATTLVLIN
jgi:hypothetical protein